MKKRWVSALVLAAAFVWMGSMAAAAPKGQVTLGMGGAVTTFDPHVFSSLPISFHHPNVFDTLLRRTPDAKLESYLAKSYKLLNPRVWEFKLHEGIKFSNGEPLDAEAVKFSFERIADPRLKSRQIAYFKSITRVEATDRYTVRFHLKTPDFELPSFLGIYGFIVPPAYYKKHPPEYLARHPVGSGPYVVKKWRKGEEVVYEANPNYWRKGEPSIKTVTVKFIPEATTRVAALLSGDVDMIDSLAPGFVGRIKSSANLEVISGLAPRANYIVMLIKKGAPWSDPRVRMALNYAIDKEGIIKNVLGGFAKEIAVLQGPGSFGYNPGLKPFPYDPGKAKKLLAEAGVPNGFTTDLYIPHGRFLLGKEAVEAIAGQWSKIGVKVNIKAVEWGSMVKTIQGRWNENVKPFMYFLARMDTAFSAEGMYAGAIVGNSIYGGFRDAAVDKMILNARNILDEEQREKAFVEINRLLREEKVPLVFLYQNFEIFAKNKKVTWTPRLDAKLLAYEVGLKE